MADRLLLSQADAADALDISVKALRQEVKSGKIRFILIGKRRKFAKRDLEEFIEQGRISWPSVAGSGRPTGNSTSRSRVVGFEEAVRRLAETRQKSSKARKGTTPCSKPGPAGSRA